MSLNSLSEYAISFIDALNEYVDAIVPYHTLFVLLYIGYQSISPSSPKSIASKSSPSRSESTPASPDTAEKDCDKIDLNFNGTYELIQNINVKPVLAAQGMSLVRRMLADAADVIQAIHIVQNNPAYSDQPTISFYVDASVKGKGGVTKRVTYILNAKESQRMVQEETGLVFLDHLSFLEDGTLKMVRQEEKKKFQLIVLTYFETLPGLGHVLTSESIITKKSGRVIKAKRIFKKIKDSGEHLTDDDDNLTQQGTNLSIPSIQQTQMSASNISPTVIMEGVYTTMDPYSFFSHLHAGNTVEASLKKSNHKLKITKENDTLHIKSHHHLDTTVELHNTDITTVPPLQSTIGNITFQTVAVRIPNKDGEIVVKRKYLPTSGSEDDEAVTSTLEDEVRLKEILEIYQWSENGDRLTIKSMYYFDSGKKTESIQILQRVVSP